MLKEQRKDLADKFALKTLSLYELSLKFFVKKFSSQCGLKLEIPSMITWQIMIKYI